MSVKKNNLSAFSGTELENQLRITLENALKKQASMNLPRVFRNKLCVKANQFIHKYPDGKMYLIEQNQTDSSETILLQL